MPFKSKAQQRFMFARHPEIAKRWSKEYGVSSKLPERKARKSGESRVLAGLKKASK